MMRPTYLLLDRKHMRQSCGSLEWHVTYQRACTASSQSLREGVMREKVKEMAGGGETAAKHRTPALR